MSGGASGVSGGGPAGEDDRGRGSVSQGPLSHWDGEPVRVWEAVWGVPRVEAWATLGSTNDRARELAVAGAAPFTVVVSDEQTAGRGRGGRAWASPAGAGLWMSVVLPGTVEAARRLAPLLTGLAVCRAAEAVAPGVEARLKWPNDVLVGGRKVCGILCEGRGDAVVAGIGVNVRQAPGDFPEALRSVAVSLEHAAGAPVPRGALAGRVVRELRALLARPTLRLEGAVADELARRDALCGRAVRVGRGPEGETLGVARGVGPDGALRVEDGGGEVRTVVAGTVRIVEAPPEGS